MGDLNLKQGLGNYIDQDLENRIQDALIGATAISVIRSHSDDANDACDFIESLERECAPFDMKIFTEDFITDWFATLWRKDVKKSQYENLIETISGKPADLYDKNIIRMVYIFSAEQYINGAHDQYHRDYVRFAKACRGSVLNKDDKKEIV